MPKLPTQPQGDTCGEEDEVRKDPKVVIPHIQVMSSLNPLIAEFVVMEVKPQVSDWWCSTDEDWMEEGFCWHGFWAFDFGVLLFAM